MKRNLYDLVGVPPEAPREMVASACRRRIAKLEGAGTDEARAEIYAVREAWSILGDEKLRAAYDASLAAPKEPAPAPAAADLAVDSVASTLLKPRRLLPENWDRYRKLAGVIVVVGVFALMAAWNQGNRVAAQKRMEAAVYEAEYGEPPPGRRPAPAAAPAPARAEEPFSAEKFERDLKAREAAIQEEVAAEQTAREDEFREKNQRDNERPTRRRSRHR